jgi:hypothetical protein
MHRRQGRAVAAGDTVHVVNNGRPTTGDSLSHRGSCTAPQTGTATTIWVGTVLETV